MLSKHVDQTVLLLGQSSNAITHHRTLNVLGSVMNSQYQVKSMFKEKASLLQKQDEHLFGKRSGIVLLTSSNPRNKPKRFLQNTKSSFHLAPYTHRDNVRGKSFFSQKPDRKNSILVTTTNNSNVIPVTERQRVSNRDMAGMTAPQQNFFQHGFKSSKANSEGIKRSSPFDKKIIFVKKC